MNCIVDMRMQQKHLLKMSAKAQSEEKLYQRKTTKQLEKRNTALAMVEAENAVRKHHEAIKYAQMASRLDAVRARVEQAQNDFALLRNISKVTKSMDMALKSCSVAQVTAVMEKFEANFDTMDVQTETVKQGMVATTATMAPQGEVEKLMAALAVEHAINLDHNMPRALESDPEPAGTPLRHQRPSGIKE